MKTLLKDKSVEETIEFDGIRLLFSHFKPGVKCYENEKKRVFILGSPIYNDRIECDKIKEKLLSYDLKEYTRRINGSFLFVVFDKARKTLEVVNDRFASIAFYYRVDKGVFTGAVNYSDIWKEFRSRPYFKMNKEAFYEFLYMRRLLGDKTYDNDTRFLGWASILSYSTSRGLKVSKYWRPDCEIEDISLDEGAERLSELIKQSFNRMTQDSKKFGLLLSGGLDVRAILAVSNKTLTCFTTCMRENNEYEVAKRLSASKNYEHLFIKKPKTYYSDIIAEATQLGSAMSIYANAHFLNMGDRVSKNADVLLHGYGFDFLFRGKYLPLALHPFLKKFSYRRLLVPLKNSTKEDISRRFQSNLSSRLKSVSSSSLLKEESKKKISEYLYCEIRKIVEEAGELSDNPYKWWDYCCFHNISRHYTWLNILSMRAFLEERTVAFDNDLFDFFWSLDPRLRVNGKIFKKALNKCDKDILSIKYANTNLSPVNPWYIESLKKIIFAPPSARERSWPIDADLINKDEKMKERAKNLCGSSGLDSLEFLNMDTIKSSIEEHIGGRRDHTTFILSLITLDEFLK